MSQWPYDPIDTHADDALSRFTYQYKDMDALQGLARLWAERLQTVEDATYSTLTTRWLDDAAGVQLDELGAVVGEPRLARDDESYRDAIGVRVSINQSGGEPERIIEFLIRVAGATNVFYKEIYPAKIEIFVNGGVDVATAQRLRRLVPAGVGTIYISESGGELPFGTKDGEADTPSDVDGWGELGFHTIELSDGDSLELSDGDILGVTDKDDPILPVDGGVIAELIEV